jgi:hypothetical protein
VKTIPAKGKSTKANKLVCRIVLSSTSSPNDGDDQEQGKLLNTVLGFVLLPSKTSAKFADARRLLSKSSIPKPNSLSI